MIQLTTVEGLKILLNPVYITSVREQKYQAQIATVYMSGTGSVEVRESLAEIREAIESGCELLVSEGNGA
jgi:hypothetical protein